jgi:DNA polymerase bacteriophage-type
LLIHSGAALRSGEIVILNLDIETFSTVPIKHGAHRYAEEAEILLVALAVDDDPVQVWDVQDRPDWRTELQAMIDAADTTLIHNSSFDRTVLRHCGVHIPVEKIEDTMVVALQHSLPGALGTLCDVLGVPQDKAKDKDGKKLIHLFTKPRPKNVKLRRATRETHPDEWQRFIEYARLDVVAMRQISQRLPRWNCVPHERHLWLLDQETGDRGVSVDLELARSAIRAFQRASGTLAAAASSLTDGAVTSAT